LIPNKSIGTGVASRQEIRHRTDPQEQARRRKPQCLTQQYLKPAVVREQPRRVRLHPQFYAALRELAETEGFSLECLVAVLLNAGLDQRSHKRS
jgi:hypothetical protein